MSIDTQLRKQVAKALRKAAISTLPQINQHLRKSYKNLTVVESLKSGLLASQFGLTVSAAESATNDIIDEIAKNTTARFVPGSGLTLGSLVVEINLTLSSGLIEKHTYLSNDHEIQWLEWLTSKGTQVVVDHNIIYGDFPSTSRSGKALMEKQAGGIFRVAPEYAGTIGDNFLSRHVTEQIPAITQLMITGIRTSFNESH